MAYHLGMLDLGFRPRSGCLPVALLLMVGLAADHPAACGEEPTAGDAYAAIVAADRPVAWWRMEPASSGQVGSAAPLPNDADPAASQLVLTAMGDVQLDAPGPAGAAFPDFAPGNRAVRLPRGRNYLSVDDPGSDSLLDFHDGDSLTIEAWIQPAGNGGGQYGYIVGKGRTENPGLSKRNQNYALRLAYGRGAGQISFLFMDAETPTDAATNGDAHRWTSERSLPLDNRWHHVAISYTFGQPDSIRGYIDGKSTPGSWDLAGPTTKRPVVDNDQLWIGSSVGGRATFAGSIDEVAIYRKQLPATAIARHVNRVQLDEMLALVRSVQEGAPAEHVQFDLYEQIADTRDWQFQPGTRQPVYESDVLALTRLPEKYNALALRVDRPTPLLVHAYCRVQLPAGSYQLLLRSLNAARLYADDQLLLETPFLPLASNGHQPVYEMPPPIPGRLSLPVAHNERLAAFQSEGTPRVFSLLAQAGHQGRPAELGELVVAIGRNGETFRLLGPGIDAWPAESQAGPDPVYGQLTDAAWPLFLDRDHERRRRWQQRDRQQQSVAQREYWRQRHDWAARSLQARPQVPVPDVRQTDQVHNDIDRFIQHRLEAEDVPAADVIDDRTFLRRLTLDTTGIIPTAEEIATFLGQPAAERRAKAIDRLLESPGWADHWVGYWQDVLAENPGLSKPKLNNSGPFRYFLYESFLDNKPFDRFVTELVRMEGGARSGGPGGFALAANNDVPTAAKAHILATAFLGVEMKCARCHDAPSHMSTQQDLFALAAMLRRAPVKVPGTSTVPGTAEELQELAITVSLKPGSPVHPHWSLDYLFDGDSAAIPAELIRDKSDTRQQLAWQIVHPANRRFAQVIANRLWKRYMGRGLVEPVQDWEAGQPSHPQLLDYLAAQFVLSGYDLKQIARMIFTSRAYQRRVENRDAGETSADLFASASQRRMTAEQLVDSIFLAVGKPLDVERLSMNADGRQVAANHFDLGMPRRAWELVCTSNERERPSMTLPRARSVLDLLMAYGWRQDRQEPISERDQQVTPLSPLVLANGTAASRAVDLSDNGQLVDICLESQSVEQLVERFYVRFFGRPPETEELETYVGLLDDGYSQRATGLPRNHPPVDRSPLTWSNNLDAKANQIGEQRQQAALAGDPPTRRLTDDWRARVEDMVWTLINSPEFMFVP